MHVVLGDNVFGGCQSLTKIAVEYGSEAFSSVGDVLFNANGTVLVAFPKGLGGVYQVPDGTIFIGKYAFSGNNVIHDVTLPDGVTNIENSAFTGCQNLTAVSIPESLIRRSGH